MKPVFKSRENTRYVVDGKEVWESRSNAVGGVIFAIDKDNIFVLGTKRSKNMPEGGGLWVVPSGYLNYDEDGWDAMRRETYEESSFFVDKYKKYLVFDNDQDSFYTHTKPTENRQNVVIWFCLIYDFSKIGLPKDIESYKDHETDIVKWIPLSQIFNYKWSFKHDERIEQAALKFKNYLK
jgi:8-oxo-dGTP pyrophosphatase MutT (NUDIX family)